MKRQKSINELLGKEDNTNGKRDFVVSRNNSVVAVYVVNPEILAYDDASQRGKPFLFYVGGHEQNVSARHMTDGMAGFRPYVGKQVELEKLLEGRDCSSELPQTVNINGEEVSKSRLCGARVPFSGGVYHEQDVEKQRRSQKSITRLDYDKFMNQVLPAYEQKKLQEQTLGYKVKSFLRKIRS